MELSWFRSPLGQNGSSITSVEGADCVALAEVADVADVVVLGVAVWVDV